MANPVLLLVDDEPAILAALQRVFRRQPYDVLTATSGTEALALLETNSIDILISDYQMPGMSGTDLLRKVRRTYPGTFRVILSGYTSAEEILAASHEGEVQRFIPKPWNTDDLQSVIREIIDERGVHERKDYLEALLESCPVPLLITDLTGKVALANAPATAFFVSETETLIGRDAAPLFEGGAAEAERFFRLLCEGKPSVDMETIVNTARGSVPALVSISLFCDRDGRIQGTMATIMDITPLKRAEGELRSTMIELATAKAEIEKSAEELSMLYQLTVGLSDVSSIEELFELATPAVLAQSHGHAAALVARNARRLKAAVLASDQLDDDEIEEIRSQIAALAEANLRISPEACRSVPVRSAPDLPLETRPFPASEVSDLLLPLHVNGKKMGILWIRRYGKQAFTPSDENLCKTIAVEIELTLNRLIDNQDSERQKLRALVQGMPEPVVMLDEAFGLICLNPSARTLLSLSESAEEFDPAALVPLELGNLFRKASLESEKTLEEEILFADPVPRSYKVVVTPVLRTDRQRLGTVAIFHDVTHWREAERVKAEFVANVSHELRTPLTSIMESTSLLLDEIFGKNTPRQREFLEITANECGRLSRLVDDILEVSRFEGARLHLNRTETSLADVARSALDSFESQAAKAGVDLALSAPENMRPILIDIDRVTQILLNLLGNALKFTPKKGSVKVVLEDHEKTAVVRVIDSGIGIPLQETAKIFGKFHQVETTGPHLKQGAGLGLFICKALVELHGGNISVKSAAGKGTEFCFTLPRIDEASAVTDYVMGLINHARREEKNVGVLMLSVLEPRSGAGAPAIRERLVTALRKSIYKARDRVFQVGNDRLAIVLGEAGVEGVGIVQERLEESIRKDLGKKLEGCNLHWKRFVYPEDGSTQEELYAHLKGGGQGMPGQSSPAEAESGDKA